MSCPARFTMNRGVRCLVLLALLQYCCGYSFFRDRIPNGYKVEHPCKTNTVWNGVGHLVEQGGGNRNAFGLDFHANGKVWNKTLCMKDSDGDGQTNGQELGDPDCAWTMASGAMPSIPANPQTNFSWMDGCIFLDLHLFSLTQHNS